MNSGSRKKMQAGDLQGKNRDAVIGGWNSFGKS